jgi:TonB-linked SusC/RagA family outer membrane protein
LLVLGASVATAQQQTLTGRVTDAQSGNPVAAALVVVVGTNIGQHTNADGRYTIRGVSSGAQRIRVLRIGYAEQVQAVQLAPGQQATVDFRLQPVLTQLSPVVTTATGEQRRLEVGNAVAQIDASTVVETSPVANINDLLTARAPGVQVLSSGATGTGARVRIRGTNSLSLANDPVYIVDGVRIEASSTGIRAQAIGLGGSLNSRLNDLNPEEIEDIQVLRGPSAATLYGTDAANGVIVITTKRGRAGDARWSAYVEQGGLKYLQDFPTNFTAYGKTVGGTTPGTVTSSCFVTSVELGTCARDSIMTFQPLNNSETTILGTGYRQQYGLQLSGGTEMVRYFVSGEFENETGVLKLPEFERRALSGGPTEIPDFISRPNSLRRKTGRANLSMSPSQKLDLGLNIGFTQTSQRLPNLDNNLFSPVAQALFSGGRRTTTVTSSGAVLNGYRNFTPSDIFEESYKQSANRIISSATVNFRPWNFLETRGNFGLDYTGARETDVCKFLDCPDTGPETQLGFSLDDRRQIFQYTADLAGTARFQPTELIGSATTIGVQYFANVLERTRGQGENLPPAATSPAAGSVQSVLSTTDETRTLGAFIEEAVNFRERLFVTGALRYDDNSAFGADFSGVLYPKASVSWILSEEEFFPTQSWLNSLRLRSAIGQSGVRPGTNDALQFFTAGPTATARLDDNDLPGVVVSAPGNPDLKPETTTEVEVGLDWALLSNRVNLELTYYAKNSRDALIARVLPPSGGTGATTRFENLGSVTNKGFEALVNAQLFDRPAFAWDIGISGSHNTNKLVEVKDSLPAIITSATVQQRQGHPLNGYWQRKYTYNDADNDGIIRATEITVDDSASFMGSSIPKTEIVVTNGFDFLNRRLRLQALVDYKGGHYLYNNTERFKCADARNCRGRNDPTASTFEQARSVAATEHAARTLAGFIEKADFIRLREISLTGTAPDSWASRFRAEGLSVTLSARNIATFTDYTGIDPESSYGQGDVPQDFLTLPPPTYFTFRLNVRY